MICRGCDFILDTGFLGGDILDEEHQLRPGQGGVDPAVFNLADAVILGNIGDDTSSFETSDSGFHLKKDLQAARLYVSGRSQAVMSPDAVIGVIDAAEKGVRLTPFEKHVLRFIDGKRPVETIRRQAGLDEAEVKTALANLADKGVVKVVGRALSDAADFDIDTAPGVQNKKQPRRVRGTLVGAVVVVGDDADQAIDDAFRTQVRVAAPKAADLDISSSDEAGDDGDVFSSSGEGLPAAESQDIHNGDSSSAAQRGGAKRPPTASKNTVRPSSQKDAVNAQGPGPPLQARSGRAGTPLQGRSARPGTPLQGRSGPGDPLQGRSGPRPTTDGKNQGRLVIADHDASDGFDDFGDAANLATAVVQAPSISEDSSLPGVDGGFADSGSDASGGDDDDLLNINEARRVGVFADATNTAQKGPPPRAGKTNAPGGPPSNLSDLEDFDAPGIDDLADSRVEPRPILPSLPLPPRPVAEGAGARAAPPALPSMSEASLPSLSSLSSLGFSDREGSLNDDERAAMSGGVWDDSAAPEHPLGGATAATGATAGTAAEGADRGTGVRVRGDLSTSLSDLLGPSVADVDADDSVDPDNEPTSRPARRKLSPQPARAADSEADDNEPTAFRPPPAPMAAVLPPAPFSAAGLQGRSGSPRPVADPLSASAALSPARAAPPLTPMLEPSRPPPAHVSRSAPASELGWEDSTPRGRPPSKPAAPAQRAPGPLGAAAPKPPLVNAADDLYPEEGNEADDFEVATEGQRPGLSPKKGARLSDVETSELRRSQLAADAASVPPPPPPAAPLRPTPPAPARATSPTPVSPPVPAGASAPAAPPAAPPAGRLRAAPPPPEDDMTAPPSQESAGSDVDDGTHDLPVSNASSAEILDSAMVIRPAARATPLAKMVKPVADAASGPMGAAPGSNGGADDDDFMVDPDATMNLPARPKSLEGRARKPRAATGLQMPPPPASSVESAIEAPEAPGGPKSRRPPTEDMRRKARNLFELAQKDHAVGRIGAARMNAKLATIYDPDNEEFKRILEGWEDKPKGSPQTASSMARPEYVQLYEQAQDLEDEGDVDGALELLQRGVRMAPNPAAFHNRIGVILAMRKREFDRAAAEIEKAIGLEPDNPHYRSNLGKVMQKSSKRKVS